MQSKLTLLFGLPRRHARCCLEEVLRPLSLAERRRPRRLFSTAQQEQSKDFDLDFHTCQLGLSPRWVDPYMESLAMLPEVQQASQELQNNPAPSLESLLERAQDIWESIGRGGNEHLAILALRAELIQRISGNHEKVHEILQDIDGVIVGAVIDDEKQLDLRLAKAKTLWYLGRFEESEEHCQNVLATMEDANIESPLHYAAAMTGTGLSQVLACETLDDAYTVRDAFRVVVKHLEQYGRQFQLPLAAAYMNLGVAEAIYGQTLSKVHEMEVPMDGVLKAWNKGLVAVSEQHQHPQMGSTNGVLSPFINARLHANMAWGVLRQDSMNEDDKLERAFKFAGDALSNSKNSVEGGSADLKRVLTILATCYHQGGKAVTSEGLFQSAIDISFPATANCTLSKLEQRDALRGFSKLCANWEKRSGDVQRLDERAQQVEATMPEPWKTKPDILSSLWYWTPSEFAMKR